MTSSTTTRPVRINRDAVILHNTTRSYQPGCRHPPQHDPFVSTGMTSSTTTQPVRINRDDVTNRHNIGTGHRPESPVSPLGLSSPTDPAHRHHHHHQDQDQDQDPPSIRRSPPPSLTCSSSWWTTCDPSWVHTARITCTRPTSTNWLLDRWCWSGHGACFGRSGFGSGIC
jgi:hypothetical protein